MFVAPIGLDPNIVIYDPLNEEINKVSGFYFNQRTGYYEIWWTYDPYSKEDDTFLMATTKYERDIDNLLLEALAFWSGRQDHILKYVTKH